MATDIQPETPAPAPPRTAAGAATSRPDRPAVITVWRINTAVLVWTLLVAGVLGSSLFFWHRHQSRSHAAAILERARTLYAKEAWQESAAAFHRYLQFDPGHAEALRLRAEAFSNVAADPDLARVTTFFFQAVEANPDRDDVRLKLAQSLFKTRRFAEAAREAGKVAANLPEDVTAARLVAASKRELIGPARQVAVSDVVDLFAKFLVVHPGDIELSVGLAELLQKTGKDLPAKERDAAFHRADECIEKMVEQHSNDPAAYLARLQYRTAFKIPSAKNDEVRRDEESLNEQDLAKARELAPDDPEVLLASASAASERAVEAESEADQTRQRELALEYCRRLLEVAPGNSRAYLTQADLFIRLNRPDDAIKTLRRGLNKFDQIATETRTRNLGDELDLNRALLQVFLATRNVDEARVTLARLEPLVHRINTLPSSSLPVPFRRRLGEDIELAKARLQLIEGHTAAAIPVLKRMASSVTEATDPNDTLAERQRRLQLLASAYSQLGYHDLAAGAFEELVRLVPKSAEYHILAAGQWRTSGDVARAVGHYESATARTTGPSGASNIPGAWLALAEARLEQQLAKPASETRDWRGVNLALEQARTRLGDVPLILLMQASTAIARGDRGAALDALRQLRADENLEVGLLPRIAALLQEGGDSAGADAALVRYTKSGGEPGVAAYTRSELLRRRGDAPGAILALEQGLEQASEKERGPLLRRLIGLEIDSGAMRSARRRLRALRNDKAAELWVYETAADLATIAGDYDDLKNCEDELAAREGRGGSLWRYFRGLRLLATESDPKEGARQANRLLGEIERTRPNWPLTRVLRGRIDETLGRLPEAAENYELALRSGARNLTTYQWLVATLFKQNREADAASYIRQVGQIATLSGGFSSDAIPANLKAGRIEDALRIARAAAELRPNDALAQVWYGQTLALADKAADAEGVFLKAIALAPKKIETWSALVWFYSRERRPGEARKALDDLVANIEMTPLDRELVLARGCDLIGDRQVAEQHYRQALAQHARDLKLLEEVGRFYFRFDHEKALDTFKQALEIDPRSTEARRAVALLWGLRGSEADWSRAMGMLGESDGSTGLDDRRLQATLLLIRGGAANARQAAELLNEMIAAEEPAPPGDRLLLARALEELKQPDEAKRELQTVLDSGDSPAFLTLYIEFLTRQDLLEEAGEALTRLEEKDPENARTLELRADWLYRSKRAGEIEDLVDRAVLPRLEAAKTDAQRIGLLRYAADIFTRAKLFDAAEKKLREVAAIPPQGYEPLVFWLADRDRIDDALELALEKSSGADPIREASAIVRVLTTAAARSKAEPHAMAAAEKSVASALKSSQGDVSGLLVELGVLRVMQGRDAEAVAFYEQALAKDPDSPIVLNNLAVLLADVPGRAEDALRFIQKAIVAAPNSIELLDSKALVLIGVGRYAEAREILEMLCSTNRKNARYRLHLAMALYHLDEPGPSREHINQAIADGIENELLTPSERRVLRQIAGEVARLAPN